MTKKEITAERLLFLAKVIKQELKHLNTTDKRLFANPLTLELITQLENNEALAETVDAFVNRFGKLQDTLGDNCCRNCWVFWGSVTVSWWII